MGRAKFTVTLDDAALKKLEDALAEMHQKIRGQAMLKALGKGSTELAKEARKKAKAAYVKSPNIHKSIENKKGKYSTKTRPYKVIQHKDKLFDTRRIYESYSARHKTNFWKIAHFLTQPTAASTRIAGQSVRQMRSGRKRRLVFRTNGEPAWQRAHDTGKAFVVTGADGRPHPIKRVRHPGTDGRGYFDDAVRSAGDAAFKKYKEDVFDVLKNSKERFIQQGFRNVV